MNNEQDTDHVYDSGKKVSSIDWLINESFKLRKRVIEEDITIAKFLTMNNDLIEQAREMHRNEIIDSNKWGFQDGILVATNQPIMYQSAEQYYNETFKQ